MLRSPAWLHVPVISRILAAKCSKRLCLIDLSCCAQLSCWRAHLLGISSVRCAQVSGVAGQDLLLIASLDCTVSLWSLKGGLVGVMGKHTWTLSDPSTWQDPKVYLLAHSPRVLYT